jgi:hypothetical protein
VGYAALTHPTRLTASACGRRCRSLLIVPYALLALAQALRDCRAPWDQRGLIREALREVGVILLHDIENRFLGKPAMVLSQESVQVSELFVVHGIAPQPQSQEYSPTC